MAEIQFRKSIDAFMGLIKKNKLKTKEEKIVLTRKDISSSIDSISTKDKETLKNSSFATSTSSTDKDTTLNPLEDTNLKPQKNVVDNVNVSQPKKAPVGNLNNMKKLRAELEEEFSQKRAKAEKEIQSLKDAAQQEISLMKKQAKEDGFKEGKQEGFNQYAEKSRELLESISQIVKEKAKVLKEAEMGILQLSIKVAEQIIRSEISLNQAVCLNIVSEAINKITDRDQVIVKVNHSDLEVVKQNRDRLLALIDGVKNFSIIEDTQVDTGGCIIETNLGYIDARIKTRLSAIETAIMNFNSSENK